MRSDSVASFLDLARENHLLEPGQFDDLFRQPDVPQSSLAALCDFLVARKVLTAYQAGTIRAGRGYELSFAGYPIHDDLGPCPGGTAYRVAHPSLRTPLVLRRLRADWLAPADNVAAFVQRAQAASPVVHPNLAHLLDAGVHRDEPFVVLEPTDGADLDALIADIGPMPAALAVEYARQAARGLAAAHARNLPHGDLRPARLLVGPLVKSSRLRPDGTVRLRPSSTATVRIAELGLIPRRPAGSNGTEPTAYLPPERAADGTATLAGDVFMLGGCLYYLLTGRAPGASPLAVVRPDVGPAAAELVGQMMSADPAARPTAATVLARLDALAGSPAVPAPAPVDPKPAPQKLEVLLLEDNDSEGGLPAEADPSDAESGVALMSPAPDPDPLATPSGMSLTAPDAPAGWDAYSSRPKAPEPLGQVAAPQPPPWEPQPFVPSELEDDRTAPGYDPTADGASMRRKPRPVDPSAKKKLWVWLGVGVGLWVLAVVLWVALFMGGGEPEPEVKPKAVKKAPKKG